MSFIEFIEGLTRVAEESSKILKCSVFILLKRNHLK